MHEVSVHFFILIQLIIQIFSWLINETQWADVSSLELLKTLVMGAKNPFLFIFTYRPLDIGHPFLQLVNDFGSRINLTEIMLQNLNNYSVQELVANILSIDRSSQCVSLSNFICHVTNGSKYNRHKF